MPVDESLRLLAVARRRADLLAAAGLVLLPLLALGRALLPGRVLSAADIIFGFAPWKALAPATTAANPLLTDIAVLFDPWLLYAGRELGAGRFPLWNPHAFTGVPFFANPQTALLFPLTWLAALLPAPTAVSLVSIAKLPLAGLGMYWFLRTLALRPLAATIGAVAFMLDGVLAVWLQWSFATSMAMLPFVVAATERVIVRGARRDVPILALVVALTLFAGYPLVAAQALVLATLWAIHRAWGRRALPALARFGAGAALGLALAAIQLLPFLEYARESAVVHYRAQWMPDLTPPVRTAITLWLPTYYGSAAGRDFWGYWNVNELTVSVGLVPWVLGVVALVRGSARPGTRFLAVLAAVALAVVYGVPGPGTALARVPPLSLGLPGRAAALWAFAACALAGIGAEELMRGRQRSRGVRTALLAVFAGLVAIVVASIAGDDASLARLGREGTTAAQYVIFLALLGAATAAALHGLRRQRSALALLCLLAVEVASTLPLVVAANPVIDARLLYPAPPPSVRHLQEAARADGGRVILGALANLGMLYGIDEATGSDGLTPYRIEQVASPHGDVGMVASGGIAVTAGAASPAFDLLGVRHVLAAPGAPSPAPHFTVGYDGPDARVFVNPRALPRAFLVPAARACVDERSALGLLEAGGFDPRREVLLAACDAAPLTTARLGVAAARLREANASRVVVDTETDAPAYLVLTDTWFPGWRALVDGRPVRVWRADHAFRAVRVEAGRHRVEFIYRPASVLAGAIVSALAGSAAIVLLLPTRRLRLLGLGVVIVAVAVAAVLGGGSLLRFWQDAAADTIEAGRTASRVTPPGVTTPGATLSRGAPAATAAPFTLAIVPSTLTEGDAAGLRLERRSPARPGEPPFDLYLVRITASPALRSYLHPDGTWSPLPIAYRRGMSASAVDEISAAWRERAPPGWFTFAALFVAPSADPRHRRQWVFTPVLVKTAVGAAAPPGSLARLGALVLVALVPLAAVAYAARSDTDGA